MILMQIADVAQRLQVERDARNGYRKMWEEERTSRREEENMRRKREKQYKKARRDEERALS